MYITYFYKNAYSDRPIAASLSEDQAEALKAKLPDHTSISSHYYISIVEL